MSGALGACGEPPRGDEQPVTLTAPPLTTDGTEATADSGDTTAGSGLDGTTGIKLDVAPNDTEGAGDDGGAPGSCEEAAMTASNQGCEFWAVDLPNAWAGSNGSPAPQDQQFAVVVANTATDTEATVEVFVGNGNAPVDSAVVGIGDVHEFRLAALNQDPRANTYDGSAYRIESDIPITAYQFNPLDNTVQVFSNDASLLFPTHVLGTDYTAVTAGRSPRRVRRAVRHRVGGLRPGRELRLPGRQRSRDHLRAPTAAGGVTVHHRIPVRSGPEPLTAPHTATTSTQSSFST